MMFGIDRAICLNVDKRIENYRTLAKRLEFVHGDIQRFLCGSGWVPHRNHDHVDVDTATGLLPVWAKRLPSFNAFLCFRRIVKQAKHAGVKRLLILEDDAIPIEGGEKVLREAEKEINALSDFPDMLYLGANHTWSFTRQLTEHLLEVRGALCWHAVILKNTIFDAVLALPMREAIDLVAAQELHFTHRCLAVWPSAVIQEPGFSFCDGKNADYSPFWPNRGQSF